MVSREAMPKVAIVGVGQLPFKSRYPDKNYQELSFEVVKATLEDAGLGKDDLASAVYSIYSDPLMRQQASDNMIHDYLGLRGRPGLRVTAGASTGGFAMRAGFAEVASGLADIVLVLGVQKAGDLINIDNMHRGEGIMMAESITHDTIWQHPYTPFPPAAWGVMLNAHMDRFGGPTPEQLARVALKNHTNALANPNAQLKLNLTLEDILNSRLIAWPTTMYECCPFSEGAAAVILASEQAVKDIGRPPVWITGVGTSVESSLPDISLEHHGRLPSVRLSGEAAYAMAGVKDPRSELDVLEVHDLFSGLEIMAYEELGLCPVGQGGALIDEGVVEKNGPVPVNPSGGRIACGHIAGVSSVFSVVEVALQLRRQAGERQVAIRNGRGLVSTVGGPSASIASAIVLEGERP